MTKINVYLTLPGNTREAFDFYETLFGAERDGIFTYKDMQSDDEALTPDQEQLIAHTALKFENMTLMAGDSLEPLGGSGEPVVWLNIAPDSRQEADRIFSELSKNGEVVMPLADQPWDSYNGRCIDRFGVAWEVML